MAVIEEEVKANENIANQLTDETKKFKKV